MLKLQRDTTAMGQQLSFDSMRQSLKPEEYARILQTDAVELALSENYKYLRLTDLADANPKDECDHLISERAEDSGRTATLTLAERQSAGGTTRKRRRTCEAGGAVFPPTDVSGKRINQGYGGDYSFLPALWPVICKQSAKFSTDESSGKWEVSLRLTTSLTRQQGLPVVTDSLHI